MTKHKKIGWALIAAGFCTPVIAYFVVHYILTMHVANHTGAPPDQGAMIIAYFAMLASIAVGILIIGIGGGTLLVLFLKSRATTATSTGRTP